MLTTKKICISMLSFLLLNLVGCQTTQSVQSNQQQVSEPNQSGTSQGNSGSSNSNSNDNQQQEGSGTTGSSQQSNNNQSSQDSSQSSSPPTSNQEALRAIASSLHTKVPLMLPTNVPLTRGKYLTALTTSQTWYYSAQLYEVDNPMAINSQASTTGVPIATIEGTEYTDNAHAQASIEGYLKINTSDNLTINLGHNIQGVENAGTGHSYIEWNEGRWSIKIDSPNDPQYSIPNYKDNKKLAEDIVSYLDVNSLPAPQDIGVISIRTWNQSQQTTIQWQHHEMSYQITSKDPFVALKLAISMAFTSS